MMISTKGRYALRFLTDVARNQGDGYVALRDVARRQEISEKYLESIIKLLVKAQLLSGLRGKGGGYKLTRAPEQYTVYQLLLLTEESMAPVACLEEWADPCARAAQCRTLELWRGLDKVIRDYLSGVTLADLMKQGEKGDNYVI